jgi:hypothetical protein
MPTGTSTARNYKLLGTKRVAQLLVPFAGNESERHSAGGSAEWFVSVSQPLSRAPAIPVLEIVVWQAGHELGRWPLHNMAYGSLVSGLVHNPAGPFAIPHAKGFFYDDYAEVGGRVAAAEELLTELIPPYNALLFRLRHTERAAGLSVGQVTKWLKQAEAILEATKGEALRQLISAAGPPRFATHSSYLAELLPAVRVGTQLLKSFLALSPPPVGPPDGDERATAGANWSRWDWKELRPITHDGFSDLAMKMYEYLPEVEMKISEAPDDFFGESSAPSWEAIPLPKAVERPSTGAVRSQLLAIRQQVDDLLANMER